MKSAKKRSENYLSNPSGVKSSPCECRLALPPRCFSQELDILISPCEYRGLYSPISDCCHIIEGVTEIERGAPSDPVLGGERRKWLLSKRICQTEFADCEDRTGCGRGVDIRPLLFIRIICSQRCCRDVQRPAKTSKGQEHNDNSERRQITALSRVKMFPFSQIKQFVPKAGALKRRAVMPNTIEYASTDLLIAVFSWQFIGWLQRQKNC